MSYNFLYKTHKFSQKKSMDQSFALYFHYLFKDVAILDKYV